MEESDDASIVSALLTAASLFALSLGCRCRIRGRRARPARRSRNPNPSTEAKAGRRARDDRTKKKKKDQKSEQEFRDGYRARLRAGAGRRLRGRIRGLQGARRRRHAGCRELPRLHGAQARRLRTLQVLVRARARAPTRSTCAPGSITACGTSSRATCSRPPTSSRRSRLICGTELQGISGPQGRHGRHGDVLSLASRSRDEVYAKRRSRPS